MFVYKGLGINIAVFFDKYSKGDLVQLHLLIAMKYEPL